MVERYDPARARFRTYLRLCLDGFASNARKAERRLKRGGDVTLVPLDFQAAERRDGASRVGGRCRRGRLLGGFLGIFDGLSALLIVNTGFFIPAS